MAATGNPVLQMVLPMAEMVGYLRDGVGELVRRAGLQLLELMMEAEGQELVGASRANPRRNERRTAGARAGLLRDDGAEGAATAAAGAHDG